MEDDGILAKDDNQLTLIYSSESRVGKQVLGYAQATEKKLRAIDIAETSLGDTVWVEIAEGLGKSLGELFDPKSVDSLEIDDDSSFDTDDWLKLIDKNPALLHRPIAISGDNFKQVSKRGEILQFFSVDSAGLEKHIVGDEPTTSSTTEDESFTT